MTIWLRHKEREKLWKIYFSRGKSVAQIGPRRIGKTFLMTLLEQDAAENNFRAIRINLETEVSVAGATAEIARKIINNQGFKGYLTQFIAKLKTALSNVDTYEAINDAMKKDPEALVKKLKKQDGKTVLTHLLATLNDDNEQKTLLLVDELSVCLQAILSTDREAGKHFLHILRDLRSQYPNVIWLITGSIGLDQLEKKYQLDATNDLHRFDLKPLTTSQAVALLRHECRHREIAGVGSSFLTSIVERQGWLSPHYLLKWLDRIEECLIDNGRLAIDENLLDSVEKQLLSFPHHQIFNNWVSHLNRNYPDQEKHHAKRILKVICQSAAGRSCDGLMTDAETSEIPQAALNDTLNMLCNDGFLGYDEQTEKYDFIFTLLKKYWQKENT